MNGRQKPERRICVRLSFSDGLYRFSVINKKKRPDYMTAKQWGEWLESSTIEISRSEYDKWVAQLEIFGQLQDRLTELDREHLAKHPH